MKIIDFKRAKFVTSAVDPEQFPKSTLPEIAVAGRSNVGKSSLLNHLFRQKNLVKTSSKPGKTQTINFFVVPNAFSFVDLPGYGYAKVPFAVRAEWGPMIQKYFEVRQTLMHLLLLFDCRRIPSEEDLALAAWAAHVNLPYTLILTKIDKLNQKEKRAQKEKILEKFGQGAVKIIDYSILKGTGRGELEKHLLLLGNAHE